MTSPIPPISGSYVPPVGPRSPAGGSVGAAAGGRAGEGEGAGDTVDGFAGAVGQAVSDNLGQLGRLERTVTESSQRAAVGDLESVSDFMIATAEAQLATEVTVAVRDRAITAFNDIMRMQI